MLIFYSWKLNQTRSTEQEFISIIPPNNIGKQNSVTIHMLSSRKFLIKQRNGTNKFVQSHVCSFSTTYKMWKDSGKIKDVNFSKNGTLETWKETLNSINARPLYLIMFTRTCSRTTNIENQLSYSNSAVSYGSTSKKMRTQSYLHDPRTELPSTINPTYSLWLLARCSNFMLALKLAA